MVRHLVTSALPYANGSLHLGHVVGAYITADVYVRTLRMKGEEVLYVCGTDEHGTSISIGAEEAGVPYPEYVATWRARIKASFDAFGIEFDVFSGTSICPYHAELSQEIFRRLDQNGYLLQRSEEQLYCPNDERFLADRFVLGTCYACGFDRARGDECPRCGAWLDAKRLVGPRCRVCGAEPELRATTHWYLDLPKLRDEYLGAWFRSKEWKQNVRAFVDAQLEDLRPRPITRDMKWGIAVPEDVIGEESSKVLYVWFDAPIGYISFTREWADKSGDPEAWERWWKSPETRLVHFIGKDNIPFHCLIFPAMLWGAKQGYVLPWAVPANEFYNLQGRKFNTSERWTIPLEGLFERYDRDTVRFHLLASAPETADSEWRWEEFQRTANASLADTIGNLATRVLRFVAKHHDGRIPTLLPDHEPELDRLILAECGPIGDPAEHVLAFRFRRAAELIVANATVGNVFVDRTEPWALQKRDPERAGSVLATACEWLAWLARWMAPATPAKAQLLWAMLGFQSEVAREPWPGVPEPGRWRSLEPGRRIGEVRSPFAKISDEEIADEVEALRVQAEARG